MKKLFLVPILVILMMVIVTSGMAQAEWLYATRGNTFVHVKTDQYSDDIGVFMKGEKIWVYDHILTSDGRNWCKVSYLGETGYISDRYSSYSVSDPDAYEDVNRDVTDPHYYDDDDMEDYDDGDYYDYDDYEDGGDHDSDSEWFFYTDDDDDDDEEYYYDHYFDYQTEFEFVARQNTPVREWFDGGSNIGQIKKGESVWGSVIYTNTNDTAWLEVYIGEDYQCGYVPVSNFRIKQGNFPQLARCMIVTGNTVNARETADINSKSVKVLKYGDVLNVEYYVTVYDGEYRIWAYCLDDGYNEVGFVSTKYLRPEEH